MDLPKIYAHIAPDGRLLEARAEPPVSSVTMGGRVYEYAPVGEDKVLRLVAALREFYPTARADVVHNSNGGPSSLVIEVPDTKVLVVHLTEVGMVRGRATMLNVPVADRAVQFAWCSYNPCF